MTNQLNGLVNDEFWEVRAEMTAQSPIGIDLPTTLVECELRGALPRDL